MLYVVCVIQEVFQLRKKYMGWFHADILELDPIQAWEWINDDVRIAYRKEYSIIVPQI